MGLLDMYIEIYYDNEDNWVSLISGKPLYRPTHFLFINQFAHIVSKARCKSLKFRKDNIMIVTPDEHTLLDHKGKVSRDQYEVENDCSFGVFYDKRDELLKEC